jgi:tRNA(Ile2) C34 agmatinyltransferase TiaS
MEFTKEKLQKIKQALQYALIFAQTEAESAEFAILLVEIETGLTVEIENDGNYPLCPDCGKPMLATGCCPDCDF